MRGPHKKEYKNETWVVVCNVIIPRILRIPKDGEIMKRTAIYIRVSSDRQAQEGDSIPAQRDALKKYIDDHNDMILAGEYLDDGISGTRDDRDELQRLLSDVRNGQIDLILVTKLDRLYRSTRHYLNLQDTLDKYHVNWTAIWEPIYDTTTPQGRLIITQMMSIAQFEAENTGQRIRQVQSYKISQGEVISGSTPPGYSIENKHLAPNDDADAVRQVFNHYARNGNLHDTMRFAVQFGIFPTTSCAFKKILQNQTYIGVKRDNPNFCTPIINKELFDDVQNKLNINIKSSTHRVYIFSGLLRCAECGSAMGGMQTHGSSRDKNHNISAYRCAKRYAQGGLRLCTNTKVMREYKLEEYMMDNIRPMIKNVILEYETIKKPTLNNEKRIAKLEKRKDRLKDLYISEMITLDEYKRDREQIDTEIASLRPVNAPRSHDTTQLKEILAKDIESLYGSFTASEKRYFWRSIIKEITFDQNRNIKVEFLP